MLTAGELLIGALFLSLLHSAIPNHWGPFILVGKSRKWTRAKLAAVTFGAGFLHSMVTLALGVAIAYAGTAVQNSRVHTLETVATALLICMGLFLILGRIFGRHFHNHFEPARVSATTDTLLIFALVGMLSLSPCAEILPLYLLAAAAGWKVVILLSVVVVFGTTVGMTVIVVGLGEKISNMRWKIIEENEGLLAGILLLGFGIFAATHRDVEFLPVAHSMALFGAASLKSAWKIFQDAAPYILFGCLMGGLVYAFIRPERVAQFLGKGRFKPVINAALFGIPLPLCSCGVIPTALTLRRMGATRGATTAFLITTPETGVDSIAVTYALLDPIFTVFRPLAAFCTGVTAGVLEVLFGVKDPAAPAVKNESSGCEKCHSEDKPAGSASPTPAGIISGNGSIFQKLKTAVTYGLGDFLEDISPWLVVGFLAAGVILTAVPPEAVEGMLGGGLPGMLIVLVVSIPLYICASATTPLAAALLLKGASPGAALVLLLAGPASNTAGIVMLTKFLGKRSVLIYVASIAICSLGFGVLLNHIYLWMGLDPKATMGMRHGEGGGRLHEICAVLLLVLVAVHLIRQASRYMFHHHEHQVTST